MSIEAILAALDGVYADVPRASGVLFRFSREDRKKQQNSHTHTFYLAYERPLPGASAKELRVDITISEQILCPLQERLVVLGYDEYDDPPEDCSIRAYTLDEMAVEKIVALTDRARNEPRDLYDIWHLTSEGHVDLNMLMSEIDSKLEFRERTRDSFGEELAREEKRYTKLWVARLGAQLADLPPFDQVYRAVSRSMRAAGFMDGCTALATPLGGGGAVGSDLRGAGPRGSASSARAVGWPDRPFVDQRIKPVSFVNSESDRAPAGRGCLRLRQPPPRARAAGIAGTASRASRGATGPPVRAESLYA